MSLNQPWQIHDIEGCRKYLNRAERTAFLESAARLPITEHALCALVAYTGCRISEALGLHRHHLDIELGRVALHTLKRRRAALRHVPVPRSLVRLLCRLPSAEDGRFWNMHRATAWRLIKRTMLAAEVDGPMATCKGLRHAFGIHAAICGVPPSLIQRWMGHASPTTTAIYLDVVGPEEWIFANRMWR